MQTTDSLGEYAERRLEIMCGRGSAAHDEIRELTLRMDALAAEYAAADPLGESGRIALFQELADLVDDCLSTERRAIGLLEPVRQDSLR